jgi:ribosomal protein S18 acetylase RimI-like enzyme
MEITLREDLDPDTEFYYQRQFEIYHDSYLIWGREIWEEVLSACEVYQIEVDGDYAGDVIWEKRGSDAAYIVDFSILPRYQGKGIGREVLEQVKKTGRALTAVTRKETLPFFLKSGFVLKKRVKNYYFPGVAGYYLRTE